MEKRHYMTEVTNAVVHTFASRAHHQLHPFRQPQRAVHAFLSHISTDWESRLVGFEYFTPIQRYTADHNCRADLADAQVPDGC
jgi:hypothetical protein